MYVGATPVLLQYCRQVRTLSHTPKDILSKEVHNFFAFERTAQAWHNAVPLADYRLCHSVFLQSPALPHLSLALRTASPTLLLYPGSQLKVQNTTQRQCTPQMGLWEHACPGHQAVACPNCPAVKHTILA